MKVLLGKFHDIFALHLHDMHNEIKVGKGHVRQIQR